MKSLLTAAFALALPLSGLAAELTLDVQGLDASRLQGASLMVAVFTEPGSWLKQPQLGRRFSLEAAAGGKLTLVLKDLPDGPLALSVFQDANGNGRLDMNPMGMPVEPFGFSNDAVGNFGPPTFEQALIRPVVGQTVAVRLH